MTLKDQQDCQAIMDALVPPGAGQVAYRLWELVGRPDYDTFGDVRLIRQFFDVRETIRLRFGWEKADAFVMKMSRIIGPVAALVRTPRLTGGSLRVDLTGLSGNRLEPFFVLDFDQIGPFEILL